MKSFILFFLNQSSQNKIVHIYVKWCYVCEIILYYIFNPLWLLSFPQHSANGNFVTIAIGSKRSSLKPNQAFTNTGSSRKTLVYFSCHSAKITDAMKLKFSAISVIIFKSTHAKNLGSTFFLSRVSINCIRILFRRV